MLRAEENGYIRLMGEDEKGSGLDKRRWPMIKIAHVSDLHFHRAEPDNGKTISLLGRVQGAYSFNSGYNYMLATGDITDDGDEVQYAKALAAFQPFISRLLLAPGNHDYGPLGNLYLRECAEAFDSYLLHRLAIEHRYIDKQPAVDVLEDEKGTQVLAVGLNSVLETSSPLDFARGAIGPGQLTALQGILSAPRYSGMHKLVYLHHRPQKCDWFLELMDTEDFMAILNHTGVEVVAFGHTGGNMSPLEPSQARIVRVFVRKFGVKYLLNANCSVDAQKFNEIVFDGPSISVKTV